MLVDRRTGGTISPSGQSGMEYLRPRVCDPVALADGLPPPALSPGWVKKVAR